MTLVIMLQGPHAGKAMNVASANAGAGIADGWAAPTTNGYPYPTDRINKQVKPAASYDTWVAAGSPAGTPSAPAVVAALTKLTKTSPSVVTMSAGDFAKFATGDYVIISGTVVPAINGKQYRITNPNGTNKTFDVTGLDLVAQPADLTAGTMTKV